MGLSNIQALVEGEYFPVENKKYLKVTRRIIQSDPVYAAMIYNFDMNIGRLLDALEETGERENMMIIFTSDNGGLSTAEGSPTCNAPLREGKGWIYEGGVRVPMIICWPGVIKPGSVCSQTVISTDFYPTILEIAELPLRPEQHRDGVSFMPLLKGGKTPDREAIFWHYPHYGNQGGTPGCSIRKRDFKLIEFFEDGRLELYNLKDDPSETKNLAEELPEKASELYNTLVLWRNEVKAKIPQPNKDFTITEQKFNNN